jgi:hypothetical protein
MQFFFTVLGCGEIDPSYLYAMLSEETNQSHISFPLAIGSYQNIQYASSIQFRSKVLHDAFVVHAVILAQ